MSCATAAAATSYTYNADIMYVKVARVRKTRVFRIASSKFVLKINRTWRGAAASSQSSISCSSC